MQMLPEIHRNSRTGCNYDSLGLFARFFQDGNGLPEHWNTNPPVEAEKRKALIKWKVWNIPLFWAHVFCTKIPFRMRKPSGLFCFSLFSAFVQILPKGIINKLVAWELINVNCMMKALAFITYQGGNIKKGLFQTSPLTGQGHPTTVFCEISVRRSRWCLIKNFLLL